MVATAETTWRGRGARALAASNGSFAERVAETAATRLALGERSRASLRLRLRVAVATATGEDAATVDPDRLRPAAARLRRLARETAVGYASDRAANATERWVDDAAVPVPAGLPVLPPPGTWYVTVNVWTVEVRGAYARFEVRTRHDAPGGRFRYVRDGSVALLDVDGDGEAERLGRGDRVAVAASTAVFVVVPPNGRGVGDRGRLNESSAGWPRPGCTAPLDRPCRRE